MLNHTQIDIGPLGELAGHVFEKGPLRKTGKKFVGQLLATTGCEISLNLLEAGDGYPFLHRHQQNEEVYLVVAGRGEMQVDGKIIPLKEGSLVNVQPAGSRSIRAAADTPLTYVCIQAAAGSLSGHDVTDGEIVATQVDWSTETSAA